MMYHKSVLLNESINGLAIKSNGIYVDVTFGGGGHSKEILKKLDKGRLIAFDQDEDAEENIINDERFTFINQNFRYLINFLKFYKAIPVDGIIADLGVSSHQLDTPARGFSSRFNGNLDLRMDKKNKLTAKYVINNYTKEKLINIFYQYGELTNAKQLASVIVKNRNEKEIKTINHFKEIISSHVKKGKENKYYAQVLQALRIEVNDELGALKEMLLQTTKALKPGGRLVVISYHSLEDRLVKNFIKSRNFRGEIEKDFFGNPKIDFKFINKKPITPSKEELLKNNRSRSAKLRIAEKI